MTTPPRPRRPAPPARPRRSTPGTSGDQRTPQSIRGRSSAAAPKGGRGIERDAPRERASEVVEPSAAEPRRQQPKREERPRVEEKERSGAPEVLRAMKELRRPTGQADAVELLGSSHQEPGGANVARIDELIRARKHGLMRTAIQVTLGVALAAFLVWVVFFSALFALNPEHIIVTGGNERFTDDQAQSVLARHENTPITRLSMSGLAEELRASEQVKTVTVKRDWPTGLNATMELRVPVVVEKTNVGYVLLDREAVALAAVPEKPEALPLVTLPAEDALRATALEDIEFVGRALSEQLRQSITVWHFDAHRVSFDLLDGRRVIWGTREDSELKSQTLALLLDQRSARVYDVSSPTKPTTSDS